jgi:hypothetical protein
MIKLLSILLVSIEIMFNIFVMRICQNMPITLIVTIINVFWIIILIHIIINKHD